MASLLITRTGDWSALCEAELSIITEKNRLRDGSPHPSVVGEATMIHCIDQHVSYAQSFSKSNATLRRTKSSPDSMRVYTPTGYTF